MITIEDFSKCEIRVGKVIEAEDVAESRKLIKLTVDVGENKPRTVFTGVRGYGYTAVDFQDKQFLFVTNLEPKKIMEQESQGMILATDTAEKPLFISAAGMPVGAKVR
ncbi:MAG: methionine--tRNA ligase [Patescibacteria group bacterium]|nr:methionine--tRNA ligase [Patescibacteria group bacterium]